MTHGGKRDNAGRPKGQGKYSEVTKALRVPVSRIDDVKEFLEAAQSQSGQQHPIIQAPPSAHLWDEGKGYLEGNTQYKIPLYASTVRAGFPSPADDYIEMHLDLNEHLIKHPSATFFVTASGDSMTGAGIASGDMLVVDRSLEATHGKIVIAAINGELTVKRLSRAGGTVALLPENKQYNPIEITEDEDLVIWGVVTHVIHPAS